MCDNTHSPEKQGHDPKEPVLEWLDNDVPRAEQFGDTYFSKAGGLNETRYVFLKGNGLPGRFEAAEGFTIAEFGFGTGLNFLTTLQVLRESSSACHLTFLSFELFPMNKEQLRRALAAFPELDAFAAQLLEQWTFEPGWNLIEFENATLVLGIGDARTLIGSIVAQEDLSKPEATGQVEGERLILAPIDAWYLDGFSPAKNPELWDAELLKTGCAITRPGGTLATYTSAGWVRRNLKAAGFEVAKQKGFAGKREMVVGFKPIRPAANV